MGIKQAYAHSCFYILDNQVFQEGRFPRPVCTDHIHTGEPLLRVEEDIFPLCVFTKKSASHFLCSFLIADLITDRCIDSYIFRKPYGVEGRRRSQRMYLAMQRSVAVPRSMSL